jgi:hypothetical protein
MKFPLMMKLLGKKESLLHLHLCLSLPLLTLLFVKPVMMRAFQASKKAMKNKGGNNSDDFVSALDRLSSLSS